MKHWLVYLVSCLLWTCCASQGGCEEPPDIDFGEIVSDEKVGYQEHDRIQYRCNPGFALEGSEWISCNGQRWTPSPRCLASCSITRQLLDTKNLLLSSGRRRSLLIRSNQTLEFKCSEGYVITTPSVRKCVDGHMNLPSCISERGKNCSRSPTIENGDIITLFQKEYASGSWVEFRCQQYYAMEGESRSFCNNGTWTKVPACLEPCVIALTESQQLVVKGSSYDSGFPTMYLQRGDSVELSCKPGYVLEANPSQSTFLIQCNEEPIVYPKCKEIVCSPPEVGNGLFNPRLNRYTYEDEVRIQCEAGYRFEHGGERGISKCTETGWSPLPQCIKRQCDFPIVKNGALRYSYQGYINRYFPKMVGDTVDYRCNDGFLPMNKEYWHRSTCREFGWDPEPKCFKKCAAPPSLPHGRLLYYKWTTLIEENEISFSCDEGYFPASPEAKTKCTKDGWAPTPRCDEIVTCKTVNLPNGYFQQRNRNFPLRETTTYGCQDGYATPKGLDQGEIQCLEDGWTPKPECIQTCIKPPEENIIFINTTKSVFLFMEKLHYECKDGYETINQTTGDHTVCTKKGWSPKPDCQPIQCDVPHFDHGRIQPRKDLYLEGDVLQFSCPRRYTRVGSASVQCYHFGWSPPPPICKDQVSPCSSPPGISNGKITGQLHEEYPHGASVEYMCNIRFAMVGSSKIECVDGEWTTLPSCTDQVSPCSSPPGISNGKITGQLHEEYPHGASVEYMCNIRFAMVGSSKIECVDGEWTTLPSCTAEVKNCGPPPNITNGHPVSEDGEKYFHGATMDYKCEENFFSIGPNAAKCLHGKWELPSCVDGRTNCAPPKLPRNANFLPPGPLTQYKTNSTVSYSCGSNRAITKCVNGKWSPEPQCKGLCPPPPQLPNAIIQLRNSGSIEKIRFVCKEHFLLQGPQEIACENGKWQTPPRCIDLACGEPPAIENGDVKGNRTERKYPPGRHVEYQCHEGFEISGTRSVTCKNRNWSQPPTCNDATCPPPPSVSHGQLIGQPKERYLPFEKVRFRCDRGWSLFGPQSVTCSNKQWTEMPTCTNAGGMCGRPPVIENGDILESAVTQYKPNSIVNYKCVSYYIMRGSPAVQCIFGHWTEAPTCIAACTATEEAMLSHKIQLRWESAKKLYSRSGQEMEFACRPGFHPAPSSSPFRVQCVEGNIEYPTCIKFCITNEQTMRNRNIQLTQISETGSKIPSGDVVEFTCRPGYREAPRSPPFRVQCNEGNLEYPRCTHTHKWMNGKVETF